MKNFEFYNPTRLVFGKGELTKLSVLIPKNQRILLVYGGGSIKRHGIYDAVINELKGYEIIPFGGIEPNPDCTTIDKAIALGKKEKVDFVLAVGGGSVIDAAKVIGTGLLSEKSSWDLVRGGVFSESLPVGTVLTVPATGSEMNNCSVISNREKAQKFAYYSQHPTFSILDPTYTYTLSDHQVACGIADIFMHTLEQYLTFSGQSGIMDRMAEGVLLNLMDFTPKRLKNAEDYDLASEYMLTATIALNRMICMGVEEDWLTHLIGHELTALTDTTHGASLMMILPSVMTVLSEPKRSKLLQLGERVYGITGENETEVIHRVIDRTVTFIHSLGLPASIREAGIDLAVAETIAQRFEKRGASLGEHGIGTPEKIREILMLSAKTIF